MNLTDNIDDLLRIKGEEIVKKMKRLCPVDTGRLRSSLTSSVDQNVLTLTAYNYGMYVDEGTITLHQPTRESHIMWDGVRGRSKGKRKRGGIKPTHFTAPLSEIIDSETIIIDIKKLVIDDIIKK